MQQQQQQQQQHPRAVTIRSGILCPSRNFTKTNSRFDL
jgi:hypothetical protein